MWCFAEHSASSIRPVAIIEPDRTLRRAAFVQTQFQAGTAAQCALQPLIRSAVAVVTLKKELREMPVSLEFRREIASPASLEQRCSGFIPRLRKSRERAHPA